MPPTVEDRLHDILESINQIEEFISGADLARFKSDNVLRLATERLLEIVCEASRKLPDHIKSAEPNIDWRKMIDFGNLLRHAYHTTDVDMVWDIVRNHLPPLKSVAERRIRAAKQE
jgi:uncharacterized protein with HEPN domain